MSDLRAPRSDPIFAFCDRLTDAACSAMGELAQVDGSLIAVERLRG